VLAHLNIVISGGTGSGKTTLLNVLSGFIPEEERIVTIEDAAELQLQQDHVLRMETKTANVDGKGAVTIRDLVRNSLRMRPDRIVVGECRGGEALDMLQAMNTGHDGSLTTLHANTPRDALSRLETMVLMAGMDLPLKVVRQQISSAVDLIIQQSRLKDGTRKVTAVTEVVGMEGETVVLTDIFKFEQTGVGKDGIIQGELKATGIRPIFSPRLEAAGFKLSGDIFMPSPSMGNRR
jgi:pilus assembly protein CpaF